MKRIITFLLVVALAVCLAAPAFAATTADGMADRLMNNNWSSSVSGSNSSVSFRTWFDAALGSLQNAVYYLNSLKTSSDKLWSYWTPNGASGQSSWFSQVLYNTFNTANRLESTNAFLSNISDSSDSILSQVSSINTNLASSLLVGAGAGDYGLLDAMTSLGANKADAPFSYLSALVYQDSASGLYKSYLAELWSKASSLDVNLLGLDSHVVGGFNGVHSDLNELYIRQGNILTQLGSVLLVNTRIRQLIDGEGNNGSGLLPESIGIHSDTTAIHTDTSAILSETVGIHADTSSIDFTTQNINAYIGEQPYLVDDFDTRDILSECKSQISIDDSSSIRVFLKSSSDSYLSILKPLSFDSSGYYLSDFSIKKSPFFPAGTYRLVNCGISISAGSYQRDYFCSVGESILVDIPYDFYMDYLYVRVDSSFVFDLPFKSSIHVFGPLEVAGTNGLLQLIANKLSMLQFSFADSDAIDSKLKNQGVIDSATEDFFGGTDSKTSLGTGGLGNIKSVGNVAGTAFESGASAGDLGSALEGAMSSDGGLGWFSQATADDLDTVPMTFGFNDPVIVTDYVGQYQSAVADWFAGRGDP